MKESRGSAYMVEKLRRGSFDQMYSVIDLGGGYTLVRSD